MPEPAGLMEFERLPDGVEFERESSIGTLVRCSHDPGHWRDVPGVGLLCSICKASWTGEQPPKPVRLLVRLRHDATLF